MQRDQKRAKRSKPKTVLRLPDLEQSRNAVLNSLPAPSSQESYGYAIARIGPDHRALPGLQAEVTRRRQRQDWHRGSLSGSIRSPRTGLPGRIA